MELKLYPSAKNNYPLQAIHIKGESILHWIEELQEMVIDLNKVKVYPLPGLTLNSISGCLVIFNQIDRDIDIRKNSWCQQIGDRLFIPQYTKTIPVMSDEEANSSLSRFPHFLHPELGLIELDEEVDWLSRLETGKEVSTLQTKPANSIQIPSRISNFRISIVETDKLDSILNKIEKDANVDKLKNEPLSSTEKLKLAMYKKLFNNTAPEDLDESDIEYSQILKMGRVFSSLFKNAQGSADNNWYNKLIENYQQLENKNKSQLDKLLDLLKNDPQKALDYAIPLDEGGTSRGQNLGEYQMSKFANNLSSLSALMSPNWRTSGGGYYSMEDDAIFQLRKQYRESAEQLIRDKKYLEASYIYIKLLKDYYAAAKMFKDARMHKEAGDIYKNLLKDTLTAAECYETGKLYKEAIEIYKTHDKLEKIGDLYLLINNRKEAEKYYTMEIDNYVANKQYMKAADITLNKMNKFASAQSMLFKGWTEYADPLNCLSKYFSNIIEEKERGKEIKRIFQENLETNHKKLYLSIMQDQFKKSETLQELTKDIAYQIVADIITDNKDVASELIAFNPKDAQLKKDSIRYRISRR